MVNERVLFGLQVSEETGPYGELGDIRDIREGRERQVVEQICKTWVQAAASFPGVEVRVMNDGRLQILKVTEYQGVASVAVGVFWEGMYLETYEIEVGGGYFETMHYETTLDVRQAKDLIMIAYRMNIDIEELGDLQRVD